TVLVIAVAAISRGLKKEQRRKVMGQGILVLALSLFVLWLSYGFQGLFVPLKDYAFQSQSLRTIQALPLADLIFVPVPKDYLLGVDEQRSIMEGQHPVFLDGQWNVKGFPHYYWMTLLWKLPHVFQLLLLAGIG